ncbi:hypothetical protein SynBIOSE41_02048 [Synechococcus sp. BIOS-E4-1]|nr:hypothetical protein SynBIOSE41_02048 [Synechococcus sp. BIOS-E4-1]
MAVSLVALRSASHRRQTWESLTSPLDSAHGNRLVSWLMSAADRINDVGREEHLALTQ